MNVLVLPKLEHVKSKIDFMYQKASFLRKPKFINALSHRKICKIKKYKIKNVVLHFAHIELMRKEEFATSDSHAFYHKNIVLRFQKLIV